MRETTWEVVEDGYRYKANLVEASTERIIGYVAGSQFRPDEGWHALREQPSEFIRLGRFKTLEAAKVAVESWKG